MALVSDIDAWLYETLSADADLTDIVGARIYARLAPEATQAPFVVFAFLSSDDEGLLSAGTIAKSNYRYAVRVFDERASIAQIAPAYERIQAVLHGAQPRVSGELALTCRRVTELTGFEEGENYSYLGGVYLIMAQGTA